MESSETAFRFLARVAGLPAEAAAPFHSEICRRALDRLRKLEDDEEQNRQELVAQLEAIIGGAPEASRHFWLSLKRDCFNGRRLARHLSNPLLSSTPPAIVDLLGANGSLLREIEAARTELESVFEAERRREAGEVVAYLEDRRFLRGVALSSKSLTEYLSRLTGKTFEEYGRREHRLVASLLRYVTRAAVKLSPFSTLTGVGLGRLFEAPADTPGPGLVVAGSLAERSHVRMQRYRINQIFALLTRVPPFRAGLSVTLNRSVEGSAEAEDNRFHYLKGPDWELNPVSGLLRQAPYSIVSVRLRGPFVRWACERLAGDGLPYGSLAATYLSEQPAASAEGLAATIEKLLEIGFLELKRPWDTAEPYPEKRLYENLEPLSHLEEISTLRGRLREILEGEEAYPGSLEPFGLSQALRRQVREGLEVVAAFTGFDKEIARKADQQCIHEDVFFTSADGQSEIADLSLSQYRSICGNLRPFARIANIHSTQTEFLHSAAAFARERWPHETSVSFFEFFEAIKPLFQAFTKHDVEFLRVPAGTASIFNPYDLEPLRTLLEVRSRLAEEIPRCLSDQGREVVLDREALEHCLDQVPRPYGEPRDFSALVQPLDDSASEWVLNLFAEGRGRLSGRFTATMGSAMRKAFAEPLVSTSRRSREGREHELIDIYCSAGHSANVHVPLTRRVLDLPGDSSGLPADRLLRLRDVRVCWKDRFIIELEDPEGRILLPAHLGSLAHPHMPALVRLLSLFGSAPSFFRRPTLPAVFKDGVSEQKRHRIGNLVFRRRTWLVQQAPLLAALKGLAGAAAFRYLDRWRHSLGMPDQVYVHEAIVVGPAPYTKPQYVDFTSPQLVDIFRSVFDAGVPEIPVVEALPALHQHFPSAAGPRRAIEIHLDP